MKRPRATGRQVVVITRMTRLRGGAPLVARRGAGRSTGGLRGCKASTWVRHEEPPCCAPPLPPVDMGAARPPAAVLVAGRGRGAAQPGGVAPAQPAELGRGRTGRRVASACRASWCGQTASRRTARPGSPRCCPALSRPPRTASSYPAPHGIIPGPESSYPAPRAAGERNGSHDQTSPCRGGTRGRLIKDPSGISADV